MGRTATASIPLSDALLLQLVDKVYEAAAAPARWREVLSSLNAVYGAHFARLFGLDAQTPSLAFAHFAGIPEGGLALHGGEFASVDERTIQALRRPEGAIFTERTLIAPGEPESTRIYNELLIKDDLPHVMVAFPLRSASTIVMLSLNRSARRGPFDDAEQQFLARLLPHLQQAAMLSVTLGEHEHHSRLSLLTLNLVPFGAVVLDRNSNVTEINAAARTIFDNGDGIILRGKRLEIASREGREALMNLIAASVAPADGMTIEWPIVVTIPKKTGSSLYRVSALPMVGPCDGWECARHAYVLLTIYDTHRPLRSLARRLAAAYRLSAAECWVAERLIAGDPPNEVSDELGISGNTVKTHLKRIYQKTGVRSQTQFMREMLLGPVCNGL